MTDQNWPAPGEPGQPPTGPDTPYDPGFAPPPTPGTAQPDQWGPPDQPTHNPPPAQPGYGPPPGQPGFAPPGQPGYAAPGQPPGGYQPPPAQAYQPAYNAAPGTGAPVYGNEPKKKRKLWPWILGVFMVILLGIGGCSFALYRAVSGQVDVANDFLAAVDNGDFDTAASLTSDSSSCFGSTARADVEDFFSGSDIEDYNLNTSNVSSVNGRTTGEVSGTITAGDVFPIVFSMVKESDDWLICGLDIG